MAKKKDYWRGVEGVRMIWHGEWSDPELTDEEYIANYWEVEDKLWGEFCSEFAEDEAPSEEDNDLFNEWLQKVGSDYIRWMIHECGVEMTDEDYANCYFQLQ